MKKHQTKEPGSFFTKNQSLEVTCIDMNINGFGVAKIDGFAIFVKGLLLNEVARIKLVKVFKRYAYAIIEELLSISENRAEPICSVYPRCGGCDLMHSRYDHQLEFKQAIVEQQLNYHDIHNIKIEPTLGMDSPYQYRNKVICPIKVVDGKLEIGFYRQNSHDIVVFDTCHVQSALQNQIIDHIKAYEHVSFYEVVKHVVLRQVYNPDQIMLGLVTKAKNHPYLDDFVNYMTKAFDQIQSIVLNYNPKETNTIFSYENILLYGDDYLIDTSLGLSFKLSLTSFFQVNTDMMQQLYQKALDCADLKTDEIILDLYCGIGTLALLASKQVKHVYGVEIHDKAVMDANENAQRNKIDNATFIKGDVKDALSYFKDHNIQCDTIIVDPPRSGLHQQVIKNLLAMQANKIVYISCNPATLGRDLKEFSNRYQIEYVQPVDMFAHTHHVETVVLLSRIKGKKSIQVDIDLNDEDLTKSESKATYQQIQEYVEQKHNLKVSSLYIAQVKRKHGIIEAENYNMGSKGSKQPNVTIEKQNAIEDALTYYQMI